VRRDVLHSAALAPRRAGGAATDRPGSRHSILAGSFLSLRDRGQATRFLYASLFAQALAMLCFLYWPVRYLRQLYPSPAR
jgi:hypothetical protein